MKTKLTLIVLSSLLISDIHAGFIAGQIGYWTTKAIGYAVTAVVGTSVATAGGAMTAAQAGTVILAPSAAATGAAAVITTGTAVGVGVAKTEIAATVVAGALTACPFLP